jgi:hypothetical protein
VLGRSNKSAHATTRVHMQQLAACAHGRLSKTMIMQLMHMSK